MACKSDKNEEKEKILSSFLTAVKECQVRFGGRTELATESDPKVLNLCQSLENVLSFGLKATLPKENSSFSAIRQVTKLVNTGLNLQLSLPGLTSEKAVLWWYIRTLLTRHEYERFLLLKNVRSDVGRGKAWIRSLLNEHSLERYIHILLCDADFLEHGYEPFALLRDEERAAMLPNLAAGLDSILFAINIDNKDFDEGREDDREKTEVSTSEVSLEPRILSPKRNKITEVTVTAKVKDHRKRRKKPPTHFWDDATLGNCNKEEVNSPLYSSAPTTCLSSPAPINSSYAPYSEALNKFSSSNNPKTKKCKDNLSSVSLQGEPESRNAFSIDNNTNAAEELNPPKSLTLEKEASSFNGPDSPIESYNDLLESLLKLQCDDLTDLQTSTSPNHYLHNKNRSLDINPNITTANTQSDKQSHSSQLENVSFKSIISGESVNSSEGEGSHFDKLVPVGCVNNISFNVTGTSSEFSIGTSRELNSANDSVSLKSESSFDVSVPTSCSSSFSNSKFVEDRKTSGDNELKESVTKTKKELTEALAHEMETSSTLRAQLALASAQSGEASEKQESIINSITRENELLRHQLKKYISAVQLLKRGTSSPSHTSEAQPSDPSVEYRDYHDEAEAYQSKLIQVAEMHGELMEFNERLQHHLRVRESQLERFKEELVELRGPLPDSENERFEIASNINDDNPFTDGANRALINVWIPSAFLSGTSSNTHHIYQIYVRIRDDEWNVYKRYAQFYELHKQLRKKDSLIKTFNFPQKKTFGNKNVSVVENRRIKLQLYLRELLNYIVTVNSELSSSPTKATLISVFPFLSDVAQPTEASQVKSCDEMPNPSSSLHYNGL